MGGPGPPETTTIPEEGPWRGPKKNAEFWASPPDRPPPKKPTLTQEHEHVHQHAHAHTTPLQTTLLERAGARAGRKSLFLECGAQKGCFRVVFFFGEGGGGVPSGASESSSEFQQLRQECDHLNVHSRNLETETLACQSARSLEQQVAQIPHLRGMFEVPKKKPTTVQAEVLRLRAENLSLSQNLDRSKEEVAKMQARCNEFWHHSDTACAR